MCTKVKSGFLSVTCFMADCSLENCVLETEGRERKVAASIMRVLF
jgi:hypothetical protein